MKTPVMHNFRWELQNEMMKDVGGFWADRIPDGILKEIWRKGGPSLDPSESSTSDALKEDGWIKVAPYKQQYDIVRYMTSVYTHYNDDEYLAFRPGGRTLDNVEIEQQLRVCFPKIYGQIANALFLCTNTKQYDDFSNDDFEGKVLKALSRHHTE